MISNQTFNLAEWKIVLSCLKLSKQLTKIVELKSEGTNAPLYNGNYIYIYMCVCVYISNQCIDMYKTVSKVK